MKQVFGLRKIYSASVHIILAVKCPILPHPISGKVTCTDEGNFGSVCTSSCEDGYYLLGGDGKRQCLGNQSWSGPSVTCNG